MNEIGSNKIYYPTVSTIIQEKKWVDYKATDPKKPSKNIDERDHESLIKTTIHVLQGNDKATNPKKNPSVSLMSSNF